MKKITKKRVALAFYYIICTIVIVFAIVVVNNIFFSERVNLTDFTDNFHDYMIAYNENGNHNDFPVDLQLIESKCVVSKDKSTYEYTLTVKSHASVGRQFEYQLFFGDEYSDAYRTKTDKPFMSETNDNYIYLDSGEEYTISYKNVLIGNTDEDIKKFETVIKDLYIEATLGGEVKRVKLPVNVIFS